MLLNLGAFPILSTSSPNFSNIKNCVTSGGCLQTRTREIYNLMINLGKQINKGKKIDYLANFL